MARKRSNRILIYFDDSENKIIQDAMEVSGLSRSEVFRLIVRKYGKDFIKEYSADTATFDTAA